MRNRGKRNKETQGDRVVITGVGLGGTGLCSSPGSDPRAGWLWVSSLTLLGLLPHVEREPLHLPT